MTARIREAGANRIREAGANRIREAGANRIREARAGASWAGALRASAARICALAWLVWSVTSGIAKAEFPAYAHVVRDGETLASIAQRYYGDPRRENVLVAENGLTTQGGAAIVVGMRLMIPCVAYHRVQPEETWAEIAEAHYGDPRRAHAIVSANPAVESGQPPEGAELLIPYPLRHIADQRETLIHVNQLYYGRNGSTRTLRRFNRLRSIRLQRGQVILVPLSDLVLSEEGRRALSEVTGLPPEAGSIRDLQARISEQLPYLQEHVAAGRYTEAVALGNRLLGAEELTGNQIVTIERSLAVAYVALGRDDLATAAFRVALSRQPDLELDSRRTSPTVLRTFAAAQEQLAEAAAAAAEAAANAADAGVAVVSGDAAVEVEPAPPSTPPTEQEQP